MACTKRTIRRFCPPMKNAKVVGEVKYACPSPPPSPSTSTRQVMGVLSPNPSPNRAMHDALLTLLDQGIMQRMASLGRLRLACPLRWPHPAVPTCLRPARGVSPGAPRGRCTIAGAAGPPESSQQLPLGHGLEGPGG
ncbi:hypothetical protein LIER_05061 [Lithospermum erythrorhizon]|uniref:Uncharacterized protein n=1 Tax=Lithospermum erythrorhizon TaxID=34254 RepID=A0AAV3NZZ3_LITER